VAARYGARWPFPPRGQQAPPATAGCKVRFQENDPGPRATCDSHKVIIFKKANLQTRSPPGSPCQFVSSANGRVPRIWGAVPPVSLFCPRASFVRSETRRRSSHPVQLRTAERKRGARPRRTPARRISTSVITVGFAARLHAAMLDVRYRVTIRQATPWFPTAYGTEGFRFFLFPACRGAPALPGPAHDQHVDDVGKRGKQLRPPRSRALLRPGRQKLTSRECLGAAPPPRIRSATRVSFADSSRCTEPVVPGIPDDPEPAAPQLAAQSE